MKRAQETGFVRFLGVLALAAAALLTAGCQPDDDEPRPAPELEGEDLSGTPQNLTDLRGQVVIVNAWASWCGPCREEMPELEAAYQEWGPDGLEVLGLNVRDRPDPADRLIAETGVNFPSIVDPDGTLAVSWGVSGMPQTFVVDRDGNIVERAFGAVDREWIETSIAPYLSDRDVAEVGQP